MATKINDGYSERAKVKAIDLYKKGSALLESGRVEESILVFKEALGLCEDYVPALIDLGAALLRAERPAQAEPFFLKALAIEPKNQKLQLWHAISRKDSGDKEGALKICRRIMANFFEMAEAEIDFSSYQDKEGNIFGCKDRYGNIISSVGQKLDYALRFIKEEIIDRDEKWIKDLSC